jgi:hypothetical protein
MTAEPADPPEAGAGAITAERLLLCVLQDGTEAIRLELDADVAGPLAARIFGAAAGEIGGMMPGTRSASWQAVRTLMSEALREAFVRAGAGGMLRADMSETPPTSADCGRAHGLRLHLPDAEEGLMWLRPTEGSLGMAENKQPPPAAARVEAPEHDPSWRRRVEALARRTELGVTLQIAELRIPLAAVSRLKPGDILPIRRPRQLRLLSGGTAIATLPAAALGRPAAPTSDDGEVGQ